jgi:hypothetical protein
MFFFHLQPKIYSGLVIAALFDGFTSHFACVRKCLTWVAKHFVDTHNHEACEAPSQKQKHKFAEKMSHGVLLFGLSQSFFNFLVRLVLPKGVDRPNHGWNPTNQRELHHKTEKTCKWTTNREEGQPRQQKRNQKSHGRDVRIVLHRTQVSTGWLTTNLHWSLK